MSCKKDKTSVPPLLPHSLTHYYHHHHNSDDNENNNNNNNNNNINNNNNNNNSVSLPLLCYISRLGEG